MTVLIWYICSLFNILCVQHIKYDTKGVVLLLKVERIPVHMIYRDTETAMKYKYPHEVNQFFQRIFSISHS